MGHGEISILNRLGDDDFFLWTLPLPRDEIYHIKHSGPLLDGTMADIFDRLPRAEYEKEPVCNFLFPRAEGGILIRKDMGPAFLEQYQFLGVSMRGKREEILEEIEHLYGPMEPEEPKALLEDVDVIEVMSKIVDKNTILFKMDFDVDARTIEQLARQEDQKRFLWMSRLNGTSIFAEDEVYKKETPAYNNWSAHGYPESDAVMAYLIQVNGVVRDKVMGNICEIDYESHLEFLSAHARKPVSVEVEFDGGVYRVIPLITYQANMSSIFEQYGPLKSFNYVLEDQGSFAGVIEAGRKMILEAAESVDPDEYLQRMRRREIVDESCWFLDLDSESMER